ncbi:WPP domain-associated protein isoform X1 [Gossypium arboreum]|uniref:WPP domain-associated protein isoform X1 n=2 Tax=Gossypium arboreum TaxID=29729 RepID=UPI0008193CE7|nr:WPP domain-associated protein isoform X1 [Gossypium arboreum]
MKPHLIPKCNLMVGGNSEMESCIDANSSAVSCCDESVHGTASVGDPIKDSGELDVDFLNEFDLYVEDIKDGLVVSRMVNDSIIRGMVNAVEQEAADRIAQKELELVRLKEMLKSYRVGSDENELLRPLTKNNDPNIGKLSAFSRLSDALTDHDKILESFGRLKSAAKGQLKNLRIDIGQIRGHGSIKKINSVSELVGLGGNLQEDELKKRIGAEKTLDSLSETLESVFEQVGNIVYSSKVSHCQWQREQEYQEEVERMVITTCIRGLEEQLEKTLWDQNAQWYGNEDVSWFEKINEISFLRQELDAISKSLSNPESGVLHSHSSLEINGDVSNDKRTDHLHQKVLGNHVSSSVSLWEGNGKDGELVIPVPENLDPQQLIHMKKDELVNFFKVEMTKMKRNHDYKLQEMTEKYFSLKREYLKERGSSLPSRKDKEFDVLRKKIPDVILKLDRILVESEKVPLLSNNNDNLSILKDRLESLLSENRQLRDALSDRKKEVNQLSSHLSDAIMKISEQSLVEENLLRRVESLKSAVEDAHIEATISWDVYNFLFRGAISQVKCMAEDSEMERNIMKEIYDLILKDASCNMSHARKSGFEDSDLESLAMEGLCSIIFREAFTEAREKLHDLSMDVIEKERVLKMEVAVKENLQQQVLLVTSTVNEKEKLLNETAAALAREKEKFMVASQELDSARDWTNQHQMIISKCNEESSVLKTNLLQASEELEQHKVEICGLKTKLDQAMKELRESNGERSRLLVAAKENDNILALVKANENEHRKQMESIIILVEGLTKGVAAFESRVAEHMKRSNLRLESLSSQSSSLIQMVNKLKRKGLQYKQSLERRRSDLEKAETEVDLLGDEVEVLLGLLEKIYIALDHYSPILKHYPGIMEILKLVRRELSGECNKSL